MDKLCLIASPYGVRHTLHHKIHAGDGYAVAQRLISCAVRRAGDICPAIGEALQSLTFQWSQAANEMGMDICLLANEIDGIFTLPCALCADHSILPEVIHTLAAVDRMVI